MRLYEKEENLWEVTFSKVDFPEADTLKMYASEYATSEDYVGSSNNPYLAEMFATAVNAGDTSACYTEALLLRSETVPTKIALIFNRFQTLSKLETKIVQTDIIKVMKLFSLSEDSICYYLGAIIARLDERGYYADKMWANELIIGALVTAPEALPDYSSVVDFVILGLTLRDKMKTPYQGPEQGAKMWELLGKTMGVDTIKIIRDRIPNGYNYEVFKVLDVFNGMRNISELNTMPVTLIEKLLEE